MIRALAPALVLALAACTPPPDLSAVEASLAPGTVGIGASPVAGALAEGAYGTRVATAIRAHPDLRRANARLRATQAEARGTEGAFLPTVSLGAQAQARNADGDETSGLSPFVRLSQLVYDGGEARAENTAAQARVLESRGARLEAASSAALRTVEVYVGVATQRDLLALARSNLQVHEELLAQIDARAASGAGVQSDVLAAQARLANARSEFVDAQARLDRAAAAFREVFGALPGALPAAQSAPPLARDPEEVVRQSARIRALDARMVAARAELSAAQARRLPRIEAGATGSRLRDGGSDVSLDLQVNYSLDSAGQRAAAVEAAQARVAELTNERDALAREIRRALDFVLSDQRAGAARLSAAREATRANARTVDATREEFTIGRRGLLDLLDAQRDFVAAQRGLVEIERDQLLTGYAALALTGDILDAFGVRVDESTPQ